MNRHIENGKEVLRRPKVVFIFLEVIVIIVIPFILASVVQGQLMDLMIFPLIEEFDQLWYLSFRSMFYHLTSFGFVILYIFLVVKYYEKRKIRMLGFIGKEKVKKGIFGFCVAFLMMGMIVLITLILKQGVISTEHLLVDGVKSIPYLLIILLGWFVQGSAEEIVFQGWLLPKIGKTYGTVIGIVVVSLLFAVAHGLNPNMSLIASLNLVMYGVFATFYVLYEKGIIGIMMFHATWNFLQGNVFGLSVSGSGLSSISFTSVIFEKKTMLNGGDFGAEGGLVASVVLLFGIVILSIMHKKRSKQVS